MNYKYLQLIKQKRKDIFEFLFFVILFISLYLAIYIANNNQTNQFKLFLNDNNITYKEINCSYLDNSCIFKDMNFYIFNNNISIDNLVIKNITQNVLFKNNNINENITFLNKNKINFTISNIKINNKDFYILKDILYKELNNENILLKDVNTLNKEKIEIAFKFDNENLKKQIYFYINVENIKINVLLNLKTKNKDFNINNIVNENDIIENINIKIQQQNNYIFNILYEEYLYILEKKLNMFLTLNLNNFLKIKTSESLIEILNSKEFINLIKDKIKYINNEISKEDIQKIIYFLNSKKDNLQINIENIKEESIKDFILNTNKKAKIKIKYN